MQGLAWVFPCQPLFCKKYLTTQQLCTKQGLKPGKAIYPQISQMDADEKTQNSGLV